jgi:hypothetical protein
MDVSQEINYLYASEHIFQPSQHHIEFVKEDENADDLIKKYEQQDIVHWDLNLLLHIHQYNPNFRNRAQWLLQQVVVRFNEE